MSFLPDIVDGKLVDAPEPKPYTPPKIGLSLRIAEEQRLAEINNYGLREMSEDFSDSLTGD